MKRYLFPIIICLINISCRTDSDVNDITSNNYIAPVDVYYVISPAAGVTWSPGTTRVIKWASNKNTNPVDIYVVKKKTYYETLVVKDYPNSGSCSWYVPTDIPLSNHYQIRISESGKEGNAAYSEVFFIK